MMSFLYLQKKNPESNNQIIVSHHCIMTHIQLINFTKARIVEYSNNKLIEYSINYYYLLLSLKRPKVAKSMRLIPLKYKKVKSIIEPVVHT